MGQTKTTSTYTYTYSTETPQTRAERWRVWLSYPLAARREPPSSKWFVAKNVHNTAWTPDLVDQVLQNMSFYGRRWPAGVSWFMEMAQVYPSAERMRLLHDQVERVHGWAEVYPGRRAQWSRWMDNLLAKPEEDALGKMLLLHRRFRLWLDHDTVMLAVQQYTALANDYLWVVEELPLQSEGSDPTYQPLWTVVEAFEEDPRAYALAEELLLGNEHREPAEPKDFVHTPSSWAMRWAMRVAAWHGVWQVPDASMYPKERDVYDLRTRGTSTSLSGHVLSEGEQAFLLLTEDPAEFWHFVDTCPVIQQVTLDVVDVSIGERSMFS